MKSLLISSVYFPPQVGGISRLMGAIASSLGRDEVCCLTGVRSNQVIAEGGVNAKVYRRAAAFSRQRHVQAAALATAVVEVMLRERPQVVQVATAHDGYLGLWLQRWLRLPFVVYAHGNEILEALTESWQKPKLSLQRASRVLAVSRFTAQLVQKAGVDPARIEILHPGCDIERFRPLPPSVKLRQRLLGERWKDQVILSVGNLVARKGHDTVIRALPRLLESVQNVTYLVVGDGPYRAELENLAAAMGVGGRVNFAGRLPDDRLPEVYALSDIFTMPSRERLEECDVEGFGLVFLEASACAKPIVAGRSGGTSDAVVNEVTGLLVDPQDPEALAAALCRLLTHRDLATRLGEQGRSRVAREFSWSQFIRRLDAILTAVVLEHSSRS
jgi:phosphatidyl-myo-inositol dimannoside synthase